jgi:arylsulfatase A-like enzyme
MNFHRGYHQFEFVRGQAEDQFRSTYDVDERLLSSYMGRRNPRRVREHLTNVRPHQAEEEWPTARTMRRAVRFLEENAGEAPLYLYVDTFSPHESWEAPWAYYAMYGSDAEREPVSLTVPYGPLAEHPEFRDRLPSIVANYAGLVTYVDAWVGHLLGAIRRLGLEDDTYIFFTSDHGTNFADNAEEVIGKPANYLYPGTMHVPLIMRAPGGEGAGTSVESLVYNTVDVPTTIASVVDEANGSTRMTGEMNGRDLRDADGAGRGYLTSRYGNSVFYVSDEHYYFAAVDFSSPRLFDLKIDPGCTVNVAGSQSDGLRTIEQRILDDAGGPLKAWVREGATDALGRPLFRS